MLGYFIDKRVSEQKDADNEYEEAFRQKAQKKALDNLKLIIIVFSGVQSYCLIYAIVMFSTQANCQYPSSSLVFGFIIWFVTRLTQYLIWIYPVMYIFWPKSLTKVIRKRCGCCCKD